MKIFSIVVHPLQADPNELEATMIAKAREIFKAHPGVEITVWDDSPGASLTNRILFEAEPLNNKIHT